MHTEKPSKEPQGTIPDQSMDLKELTAVLIRHFGHSEGFFDLVIQFQIATGPVGPSKDKVVPGAVIGLGGVGLKQVAQPGPNSLDAAVVNPASSPPKRRKGGAKRKRGASR